MCVHACALVTSQPARTHVTPLSLTAPPSLQYARPLPPVPPPLPEPRPRDQQPCPADGAAGEHQDDRDPPGRGLQGVREGDTEGAFQRAHPRQRVRRRRKCREVREVLSGISGIPGSWREPRVDRRGCMCARARVCVLHVPRADSPSFLSDAIYTATSPPRRPVLLFLPRPFATTTIHRRYPTHRCLLTGHLKNLHQHPSVYKRQRKNDPHVCSYCARGHVELKEPSLYGMMRHETVCKKVRCEVQLSLVQFSSLRGSVQFSRTTTRVLFSA